MSEQEIEKVKCPHCGEIFTSKKLMGWNPIPGKIPTHDYPRPCRAVCPGTGQQPRGLGDHRPLWKDGGVP